MNYMSNTFTPQIKALSHAAYRTGIKFHGV